VQARDLRTRCGAISPCSNFFIGLPVAQWFNRSAPAVKSGEIVPEELDEPTALALMRDNPLLIRRPLLQVGDERRVGFDAAAIDAWIGLRECRRTTSKPAGMASRHVYYVHSASGGAIAAVRGRDHDAEHCRSR
jgi:nitrogenase-associated protein